MIRPHLQLLVASSYLWLDGEDHIYFTRILRLLRWDSTWFYGYGYFAALKLGAPLHRPRWSRSLFRRQRLQDDVPLQLRRFPVAGNLPGPVPVFYAPASPAWTIVSSIPEVSLPSGGVGEVLEFYEVPGWELFRPFAEEEDPDYSEFQLLFPI